MMRTITSRVLTIAMAAQLLLTPSLGAGDLLEVLCTGKASGMPLMASILKREPMTVSVIIPTRIGSKNVDLTPSNVKRYMRLYFPRTYQDLISEYEFMLLEQIDSTYFTPVQFEWMRTAVENAGMGGLQDRSVMSMHQVYADSWAQSVLSDAYPNDADLVVEVDYHRNGLLEIILNENPNLPDVVKAYRDVLNLEVGQWGSNLMIPKGGSEIYTWSKTGEFPEFAYPEPGLFPHILGWRYGEGYTWSVQDILGASFWHQGNNPYGTDVMISMMMYSTNRELPQDVVLVHRLRIEFANYLELKGFIFSLMDFVEKFGANIDQLDRSVETLDELWVRSRDLYLEQEYQDSWDGMQQAIAEIIALRQQALELKDSALFWIYVIEWLSISGTFLLSGFALWTLMVRRRLYREVDRTRMVAR